MTKIEAFNAGFCDGMCTAWQKVQGQAQCVVGTLPSLNYRNTPVGMCSLTDVELVARKRDVALKVGRKKRGM